MIWKLCQCFEKPMKMQSIFRALCVGSEIVIGKNGKTTMHIWLVSVCICNVCVCDNIPVKLQRSLWLRSHWFPRIYYVSHITYKTWPQYSKMGIPRKGNGKWIIVTIAETAGDKRCVWRYSWLFLTEIEREGKEERAMRLIRSRGGREKWELREREGGSRTKCAIFSFSLSCESRALSVAGMLLLFLRMTVTIQHPNHNTVSLSCHRHSLVVRLSYNTI